MKTKKDVVQASTDSSRLSFVGKVRLCMTGFADDYSLWEQMRYRVRKSLKLLHFMGWTVAAGRRLLIVCWMALLAVFALDTTSHWVMMGTVSHVPPRNGKHRFITVVLCSLLKRTAGWTAPCENGEVPQGGKCGDFPLQKNLEKFFSSVFCTSGIRPWFWGELC